VKQAILRAQNFEVVFNGCEQLQKIWNARWTLLAMDTFG